MAIACVQATPWGLAGGATDPPSAEIVNDDARRVKSSTRALEGC
ncbi:MAG TPA: hypothetical protein VMB50_15455 [Myxococcales bacterium]|nr:hypothetical protein [Myxococcales bacterium]